MSGNQFRIDVKIKPYNKIRESEEPINEEHNCAYLYCSKDKSKWDKVQFLENEIMVTGSRANLNEQFSVSTINSTAHADLLKALIYYYYRWGNFSVKEIRLWGCYENRDKTKSEKYTKKLHQLSQNFKEPRKNDFEVSKLKELFKIQSNKNKLIIALTHQIIGNTQNDFAQTWQCFNVIYNTICDSKNDKASIDDVLSKSKEFLPSNGEVVMSAKDFIDEINDTRIVRWAFPKHNLDSFENLTGMSHYHDKNLFSKMLKIIEKYGQLESSENKEVTRKYKSFCRKLRKLDGSDNFDYLTLTIYYANYIRNKFFHGEYNNEQVIFVDDDINKEKQKLNQVIQKFNHSLIDQYYDKLLESNTDLH